MPSAGLANADVSHGRSRGHEIEDFCRGCAGSENGADACFVQRRSVVFGDDPTAKHDNIVQPCFDQFLADLREQVGMGT